MCNKLAAVLIVFLIGAPLFAAEEIKSGPLLMVTPEDFANKSDGRDIMLGSVYHTNSVVIGDTLHTYATGGMSGGYGNPPYGECIASGHQDLVLHFSTDDIEDDFTVENFVSPCCGNEATDVVHHSNGAAVQAPWDNQYYLFINRTYGGAEISDSNWRDVIAGVTTNGTDFTYPGLDDGTCNDAGNLNPILTMNCYGNPEVCLQFEETLLVSDGNDTLWGFIRYGVSTSHFNRVGRIRIVESKTNPRGVIVQLMTTSGWHTVNDDGSHDLEFDDLVNYWTSGRVNSLYKNGSTVQLWGWHADTSATEGCDDGLSQGTKIAYRDATETTMGGFNFVTSIVDEFPLPSTTFYGGYYPDRVDFDGDELLLVTNVDRPCETLGQRSINPWWPGTWGKYFRGMEILALSLDNTIASNDCDASATTLCLYDDRFKVTVEDASGNPGTVMPYGDQSAGFFFSDPDDVETTIKIVDGRGAGDYWWVFHGSTTDDVDYTYTVVDTETFTTNTYSNTDYCGGVDLTAFYDTASPGSYSSEPKSNVRCDDGVPPNDYCARLSNGRFQVECWYNAGFGWYNYPAHEFSDNSGACFFGDAQLLELPFRMNLESGDHVFRYGSLSNTDWLLRVVDTDDGTWQVYRDEDQSNWCGGEHIAFED